MEVRFRAASVELDGLKKDRFRNIRTYHSSFEKKYYAQRSQVKGQNEEASPLNKYEDTLNKMLLHYEHQLPSFIANVITQVIERHLMDGMEEIFEGERIHKLTDAQIRQLMEEDSITAAKRRELKDQESVLQSGLNICRDIAGRPDLGPYERAEPTLYPGYDPTARMNRPDPFAERPESPAAASRNPFSPTDSHTQSRKPVSWQDGYDSPSYEDAVDGTGPSRLNGAYSANPESPTTAEDEDAQLQRALEESKREAERKSRYAPGTPALPVRPTADDQDSITRPRRRGLFTRG
jgi:hypothetical protein